MLTHSNHFVLSSSLLRFTQTPGPAPVGGSEPRNNGAEAQIWGFILKQVIHSFGIIMARSSYFYTDDIRNFTWTFVRARACARLCARMRVSVAALCRLGGWVAVPIGCCSPTQLVWACFNITGGTSTAGKKSCQ